jgi:fermentation-respiration switch protein FrsA (DUF1100 family)
VALAVLLVPPRRALDRMVSTLVRVLVYFPARTLAADPGLFGLPFEEVHFSSGDGTELHGWWVPGRGEPESGKMAGPPAVVLFHGNGGNIGDRADLAAELHRRLGCGVILFDYRGYGKSGGKPSEQGLYADGRAAVELVRQRGWAAGGVILWGRSLGAAVALEVATSPDIEPPVAIVLDSPFTSVPAMGRAHYPFLAPLMYFGSSELYDNLEKIARVSSPLLVIHGSVDRIVPQKFGRELFEAAASPKRWVEIEGAGHNDLPYVDKKLYWRAWEEFLDEYAGRAQP